MCVAPTKSFIKDLKDGRKDKLEKFERKELKVEKLEKIERKELKREKFEKPERKEIKLEKVEKPEFEKRPDKPPKELVEDPKFFEEPPFQPPFERPPLDRPPLERPPQERPFGAGESVEDRIGNLEQAVEELSHFIVDSLRPDLGQGALSQEPDLAGASGLSQQLQQQAGAAKPMKDAKDSEKLGEY